ncbi:MAG: WG repeat-containing protein [Saprospiraceae bacterium]|nr:WG repeat-containing protein [Saprospiraceae bacterium]
MKSVRKDSVFDHNGKIIFDFVECYALEIDESTQTIVIKQDGYKNEYYLYNTKSKAKIGPLNHMNFYTEDSSPPLGMAEEQYAKYKKLNAIFIRQKNESENVWGVINMEGKELLPIKYKKITIVDDGTYKAVIEKATKPENIIFYFYTYSLYGSSKLLLLDREMNLYKYDQATKTIHKLK